MNKITKVGMSALCGSLAAISAANAGSLDVTGTATATWTSLSNQVVGNPIGMNTGLTFKGSGELDGGQTFSVTMAHTDKATWSSSNITLNTNSLGKFILSSAEGGQGIGGYDDNMPRAWEEVWDTGIATNANFQKGVGSSTNISWTSPVVAGTSIQVAYAPDNDGVQNANKGVSGSASNEFGAGWDIVLDIGAGNPVNFFIGASETDQTDKVKSDQNLQDLGGNHKEGVVGLQLSLGPLEVGGQVSAERLRTQSRNATNYYANSSWGVAFNVNDNLSFSYSEARHLQTKTSRADGPDKSGGSSGSQKSWMRGDSVQVAYTLGGVALKYAQTEYDNTAWGFDTAPTPRESRIIAVSLAF
jgi:outer membrane protein OmpU